MSNHELIRLKRFCRGSRRRATAGWRCAPALPRRVVIRRSASYSSDLLMELEHKNTRDLEWFGPPERNNLHPLRVVLLLGLWTRLSSASKTLFGPPSFSNGRLPFIEQGRRIHRHWTSTGRPNKDLFYIK